MNVTAFIGLGLAVFGWLWMAASFASLQAEWWNSEIFLAAIFTIALVLSVTAIRKRNGWIAMLVAIAGTIVATVPLPFLLLAVINTYF